MHFASEDSKRSYEQPGLFSQEVVEVVFAKKGNVRTLPGKRR